MSRAWEPPTNATDFIQKLTVSLSSTGGGIHSIQLNTTVVNGTNIVGNHYNRRFGRYTNCWTVGEADRYLHYSSLEDLVLDFPGDRVLNKYLAEV